MDAIYARQSIDKKDSISIETQIELCKMEGGVDKQYLIFADKGYSGKNLYRPDFQNMMQAVKAGKISKVIIYRLDRLSRSLLDFAGLIETFKKHNVSFVSTQERFDTATPMGNAMLSIAMVFAQLERETIQARVADNYYSRAKKGMYLGGTPPLGYDKITVPLENGTGKMKMLVENPEQAALVRRLYRMYGEELLSLTAIAQRLNEEHIPTPRNAVWDSSKVSRTLLNPVYVMADADVYHYYKDRGCQVSNDLCDFISENGCYLYGKREINQRKFTDVTGHFLSLAPHKGLIEPPLFLKCQRLLDANVRIAENNRSKHTWLFGLIRCGNCGSTLRVNVSNQGRYLYFNCHGRQWGVCDIRFFACSVSAIEQAVQKYLFEKVRLFQDVIVPVGHKDERRIRELKIQLASCREQIDRLIELAMNSGELTGKYLEEKLAEIESQKTDLERRILRLETDGENTVQAKQAVDMISDWPKLNTMQKQELAAYFIERVNIDQEGLTIKWQHNFT